jgi:hypothetical protein
VFATLALGDRFTYRTRPAKHANQSNGLVAYDIRREGNAADELIIDEFRKLAGEIRVDTQTGPCTWFRRERGRFVPLSAEQVWDLLWKSLFAVTERTGKRSSASALARILRTVQAETPVLTYDEWKAA